MREPKILDFSPFPYSKHHIFVKLPVDFMHYRILAIITKLPVLVLHNDLGELAISYLFKHLEHA